MCSICGQSLSGVRPGAGSVCLSCGSEVYSLDHFCQSCGMESPSQSKPGHPEKETKSHRKTGSSGSSGSQKHRESVKRESSGKKSSRPEPSSRQQSARNGNKAKSGMDSSRYPQQPESRNLTRRKSAGDNRISSPLKTAFLLFLIVVLISAATFGAYYAYRDGWRLFRLPGNDATAPVDESPSIHSEDFTQEAEAFESGNEPPAGNPQNIPAAPQGDWLLDDNQTMALIRIISDKQALVIACSRSQNDTDEVVGVKTEYTYDPETRVLSFESEDLGYVIVGTQILTWRIWGTKFPLEQAALLDAQWGDGTNWWHQLSGTDPNGEAAVSLFPETLGKGNLIMFSDIDFPASAPFDSREYIYEPQTGRLAIRKPLQENFDEYVLETAGVFALLFREDNPDKAEKVLRVMENPHE